MRRRRAVQGGHRLTRGSKRAWLQTVKNHVPKVIKKTGFKVCHSNSKLGTATHRDLIQPYETRAAAAASFLAATRPPPPGRGRPLTFFLHFFSTHSPRGEPAAAAAAAAHKLNSRVCCFIPRHQRLTVRKPRV